MDSIVSMRGENDGLTLKFSLHTHGCLLRGPKRHSLSPSRTPVRLCVVSTVLGTVVPTAGTMSCNDYVNGWNFRAYLSLSPARLTSRPNPKGASFPREGQATTSFPVRERMENGLSRRYQRYNHGDTHNDDRYRDSHKDGNEQEWLLFWRNVPSFMDH